MAESTKQDTTLLRAAATEYVSAAPEKVYAIVTDLSRSGEWSAECTGGRWVRGEAGAVGSVFRGENFRTPDAVAWAPVVRGTWSTESEVVDAVPGRTFVWSQRDDAGNRQESIWAFAVEPSGTGSLLTHHFRMGAPTEGIKKITAGMDDADRARFFTEWEKKLATDVAQTVARIKTVVEKG